MCNTLTDYNDRNNMTLFNAKIRKAIRKVMEEESTTGANRVTADTFIHAPSEQRENPNEIFTSEKLDKLEELVDAVKNLTINDAKYYESSTATASDTQGDLTSNPETVTHTSDVIFETNPVGTKKSDSNISPLESTPVGAKTSDLKKPTPPTEFSKRKEKAQE